MLLSLTEGRVSLLDGSVEVPIKILRDTGAVDSFILESILQFFSQSETGESMLVRGMGLNTLSVPLHRVKLHSDLVTGEVVVGLRPILPIEGVHLILGNKLAGDRVWPNVPSSPMVLSEGDVTKGVPVTVVTRSMTKNAECVLTDEAKRGPKAVSLAIPDLSDLSFPFSTDEWSREQHSDSSLAELFTLVLSDSDVHDVARAYFVQDGLLLRKWSPHGEDFVGDPIGQVVLPKKFRSIVLEVAHEKSGHPGVKKTYDRVLRFFFGHG